MFSPEFRNRLDATIGFAHLPPEIVRKVVEKFVLQLEAQLAERQVNIELSRGGGELAGATRAMTSRWVRGRWPASSRSTSRSRWPMRCCSASSSKGGTVRVLFEATEDGEGKLAFQYLSRDEEKALPRPAERKALPRRTNGATKPRKSPKREAKAE